MIDIASDTFVTSTQAKTFATIIGIFRGVRGANPANNFIQYTVQDNSTFNKQTEIESCEDYLFLCDKDC